MKPWNKKIKNNEKLFNLFILFTAFQFALHFYFGLSANDPRLILPTFIAFLHDIVILGLIWIIGQFTSSMISKKFKNITNGIFSVLFILIGVLLAFYPRMLREFLAFPVNIFDSDISSAKTFISDYTGFLALLPSMIALVLGTLMYHIKMEIIISNRMKITGLIFILLILVFTLRRPSPQPFVYSLQKKIESVISGKQRVVPSLKRINSNSSTAGELTFLKYSSNKISKYNHILLIVFEGVTASAFEKGFLRIPNGFYELNKNRAVYYNNYYASNLDSYTSLISMLTSVQVPYRAYADESLYKKVNTAPNITEDLHNRTFKTIFISCYAYQPFVPTRKYWDKIYERKDLPSIEKWLSLGSNKMESATEDKSAISTIVENVKSNKKSFILHELVYGHSPEWRATTGKTQNQYYNEYLLELSQKLKEVNRLDSTLFVIVSDHGNRAKSTDIENYRIPLLIVGNDISASKRDEFLTHMELPEIIYHYVASEKHPSSRNETFLIGSTEKWIYGKMKKDKENLFIDDAAGTILCNEGSLHAIEVYREFQEYLDKFNEKYGK